jgi:hypothetical protein
MSEVSLAMRILAVSLLVMGAVHSPLPGTSSGQDYGFIVLGRRMASEFHVKAGVKLPELRFTGRNCRGAPAMYAIDV